MAVVPTATRPAPSVVLPGCGGSSRFARAHLPLILLGFLLTLASTAAGLVPPYLTMPLMDDVLIPYQNGTGGDFGLVPWYLAGLVGAALLAWLLDWARLYVLARVSERISADLRNQTYAHLQRLSLEFFGGKRHRRPDVAHRQRHRPHLQLPVAATCVDFATDVLMIVDDGGDPAVDRPAAGAGRRCCRFRSSPGWSTWCATGCGTGFEQGDRAWAEMTSVLADTIPGIRVVKAFAQERREIERFRRRQRPRPRRQRPRQRDLGRSSARRSRC